jgi:hypothetical protein
VQRLELAGQMQYESHALRSSDQCLEQAN